MEATKTLRIMATYSVQYSLRKPAMLIQAYNASSARKKVEAMTNKRVISARKISRY